MERVSHEYFKHRKKFHNLRWLETVSSLGEERCVTSLKTTAKETKQFPALSKT